MFDIYGVAPHTSKEVRLTRHATKAKADAVVRNLSGFGYSKLRVVDTSVPATPVAPAPVPTPAPAPVPAPAPEPTPPGIVK